MTVASAPADTGGSLECDGETGEHWESRWRARPVLARVVRFGVFSVPLSASVLAAAALTQVLPRPAEGWARAAWFATVFGVATAVLVLVDRLARKLLPLAVLLRLSLMFPDRAPRRFSLALRAGTIRNLEEKLEQARHSGDSPEPAAAATRILELMGALSVHDRISRRHCERVRAFNDLLAGELKLSTADRDRLRWSALLHDIGKLSVSARTLTKAGKPSDGEWTQLRGHPAEGALLTAGLNGWLGPWARCIPEHHEHWNGAGYPNGLIGTDISMGARIVAVADAFEVMTASRPYQRPVSADAARNELARCAGTQFDPAIVKVFLGISIGKLLRVMGPLSWLAELPFVGALPRPDALAAAAGRSAATATIGVGTLLGATAGPGPAAVAGAARPAISAVAFRPIVSAIGAKATLTPGPAEALDATGRVARPPIEAVVESPAPSLVPVAKALPAGTRRSERWPRPTVAPGIVLLTPTTTPPPVSAVPLFSPAGGPPAAGPKPPTTVPPTAVPPMSVPPMSKPPTTGSTRPRLRPGSPKLILVKPPPPRTPPNPPTPPAATPTD